VISGHKPMTVADFVNANRAEFQHNGRSAVGDQLAHA
jgi:NAD(P)H dehydrogenase (quinone)